MKKISLLLLLLAGFTGLSAQQTADPQATPATKKLLRQLQGVLGKGVLFGHQDDLPYGVGWKYQHGRSDVKNVCGDYPAVYGWDLGRIELDSPHDLDSVPFDSMRTYIREAYERGGISTVSWHLNNPGNGGTAWDTFPVVKDILPGGAKHQVYTNWLDKAAAYLLSLKAADGMLIPVIFRPFHEHTGSWFWWGQRHCTTAEFVQLWRFTIQYLQSKQVHHLLYAYSAADYADTAAYLERYPGDDMVDIIGTDAYQYSTSAAFTALLQQRLGILEKIAGAHHKVPALTETGYERIPEAGWWTGTLLPVLKSYRLAYVLCWRNAHAAHHYVPYQGHGSAADFRKFHDHPAILFERGWKRLSGQL